MDPTSVPESGTFFMATHAASADGSMPPWPFNPLSSLEVPVYWLGSYDNTGGTRSGFMLVDDRMVGSVEKALAALQMLDRANKGLPLVEPTVALRSTSPPPLTSTNDLWLQLHDDDMTNGFVRLTLHNTIEVWRYQLLLRTNLGVPDEWFLGEIISGSYGTNQTDFAPVAIGETNHMLFRAHHAEATALIFSWQGAYEAAGSFPSQEGAFTVMVTSTNDMTIFYRVSGTASNGVDYTNLTGSVTVPANTGSAEIRVKPIQDGVVEGDETVVLTLIQTNSYLINSPPAATMLLSESSTVVNPYASYPSLGTEANGPPGIAAQEAVFGLSRYDDRGLYPELDVFYQVSGTASNGVDYPLLSGVLHFGEWVNDTNIQIVPFGDSIMEGIETVTITVLQSNAYHLSALPDATVTIADTSTTVGIFSTSTNICFEPNGPPGIPALVGSIGFFRRDTRGLFPPMDVFYQVSGSASNGLDCVALNGVLHFQTDATTNTLLISPLADSLTEGVETVVATLIPTNYYFASGSTNELIGLATISDSSTTVSLTSGTDAIEPNAASATPGLTGYFRILRTDTRGQYPPMTVYYQVSGTALSNVDYAILSGTVTFTNGATATNIYVQALADDVVEGYETLKITLVATNYYFTNLHPAFTTLGIVDNLPTNMFVRVLNNVTAPIGIDYHQPSNSLIISGLYASGPTFWQVSTNIVQTNSLTVTNTVVSSWSGVGGLSGEVKLAIVQTNANGFTNGDMFFGSNTGIGWLSADGTRSNLNWCVLTNSAVSNAMLLRGSVCIDRTGTFSNHVIAVTSGGVVETPAKGVWTVDAQANPTLRANIVTPHLEGVMTLTNDTQKWGPWAGKIITGDESANPPLLYTISTNGAVSTIAGGIQPEDFDIIPTNQNLYVCDPANHTVLKVAAKHLTNHVGDLLVTHAGELPPFLAKLFILHWDTNTSSFVTYTINYPGQIEHVTFAPLDLPTP